MPVHRAALMRGTAEHQALLEAIMEWFTLMPADTAAFRTDTVRQLLGCRPRTFADWCARNAGAFRPPAAA